MFTAWGYEVEGDSIPPLLPVADFDTMTGGKHAGDLRAASALAAASQAVRNFCGWHVAPAVSCTASPLSVEPRLVALPASMVRSVESVLENGVELSEGEYEWRRDGLVRRACFKPWPQGWEAVRVAYTAGYDLASVPDLAEAVRAIAEGVLAVTAGVASESADGVSISYSASASSVAQAMTAQQRMALEPYRLVVAHAA